MNDWPVPPASDLLRLARIIDPRYRALVLLAGYSGMRWGELIALRLDRIDFEKRTVEVVENVVELNGVLLPPSPPKTKAGRRRIPLVPAVVDELRIHVDSLEVDSDHFVFQAPGGGTLRKSFGARFWTPATKEAGVNPFRFHDLRHTAISYWILCGASPKQIAKWAGHSSVSVVLDRYGHLFPESDDRPIATVDKMFRKAQETLESDGKDAEEDQRTAQDWRNGSNHSLKLKLAHPILARMTGSSVTPSRLRSYNCYGHDYMTI